MDDADGCGRRHGVVRDGRERRDRSADGDGLLSGGSDGFDPGIAPPLVALAVVSPPWQDRVVAVLTANRSLVDRATGAVTLAVPAHYRTVVFDVLSVPGSVPVPV